MTVRARAVPPSKVEQLETQQKSVVGRLDGVETRLGAIETDLKSIVDFFKLAKGLRSVVVHVFAGIGTLVTIGAGLVGIVRFFTGH